MTARQNDINELLDYVAAQRRELEAQYEKARKDENIKSVLGPTVKSALEHLRSVLDYCAMDIFVAVHGRDPSDSDRIYFPFGHSDAVFAKAIASNKLGKLSAINPDLYGLVQQIQPFICGSQWLPSLASRTKKMKHRSLGRQVRNQSPSSTLKIGNFMHFKDVANVTIEHSQLGDTSIRHLEISDTVNVNELQSKVPTIPISREWEWVEFRFDDSPEDILELIGESHDRLCEIMPRLYEVLQRGQTPT
ncbi:hypothetical protein [Caballeronia sp. AZ7_KS35]|uniref:hypothetical protein n=1 Tax=Caballeronia sp. AZ7_KS35 TaxID=2921762 RepID=UPI00202865E5|nr:hypothetical protein [Caballeronia sp. AZ7_KS35]